MDQVLHQVTAEGRIVPTDVRIACRPDQIFADRTHGLIYSTSWDGESLELRTASGALQKSWPKPEDLMHIHGLWPGFGRYEVRAYGWKIGPDFILGASSVLYGFDVEEQAWQWLETVRDGTPWTRI